MTSDTRTNTTGCFVLRVFILEAKRRPLLPVIAGASSVSETTATGVNYFKTGEDPPLKADSEYPDWLWTIPEPPPSLFTLERKYSDDDALTDENYEDVSCLRPSPFRAHQQKTSRLILKHRLRAHMHCLSACLSAHKVLQGGPVAGVNSDGS